MAKEKIHDLPSTKNAFQVRGIVKGVQKDKFYKGGISKSKKNWNVVNFGVEIEPHKFVYITLNGFEKDSVYMYKPAEKKGEKGESKTVSWKDRHKNHGDFNIIGVKVGLTKGEDGKNINNNYTEYDAVEYIKDNLKDGMSVFIKGTMDFTSYAGKSGNVVRKVNLVPNQISLCADDINFEADNYEVKHGFRNTLIYTDIDKEIDDNGKTTGRAVVSGYSVGYNTVEPCQFIIDENHKTMQNNIKKSFKPFTSVESFGVISVKNQVEEDVADDDWGDSYSEMENKKVTGKSVTEFVINKLVKDSVDTETYTENDIMAAIRKIDANKNAEKTFNGKTDNFPATDDDTPWGDDSEEESDWD